MADLHLTRELLAAVSRGDLPPAVLTKIGLEHLMHLCPHCREEILAWRRERTSGAAYDKAFQALPAVLEEQAARLERERAQAARDLQALLAVAPEERERKVRKARSRFRGAALARLLIEESRKQVPGDPGKSFHFAELARTVVHQSPRMPGAFDLLALATAQMANACRARGELRQAEEHFGHVRYLVTHQGVTDTEVLARIDELEGSLRKDQRLFPVAEDLLTRAAMLYKIGGFSVSASRVLLNLGSSYFHKRELSQAVSAARSALEMLTPEIEPRLFLCGRYNLARYLVELSEYSQATSILAEDEDFHRQFSDAWTQLRLRWLRGKIAAGRGENEAAERTFLEVRDGFIDQGIGYDAAMVSLEDLAPLYLSQGRTADVQRIAEEMVPIFQAQDVHREAVAALMLFQEAARREAVTAGALRELTDYLRAARTDPSLRFREPS